LQQTNTNLKTCGKSIGKIPKLIINISKHWKRNKHGSTSPYQNHLITRKMLQISTKVLATKLPRLLLRTVKLRIMYAMQPANNTSIIISRNTNLVNLLTCAQLTNSHSEMQNLKRHNAGMCTLSLAADIGITAIMAKKWPIYSLTEFLHHQDIRINSYFMMAWSLNVQVNLSTH